MQILLKDTEKETYLHYSTQNTDKNGNFTQNMKCSFFQHEHQDW